MPKQEIFTPTVCSILDKFYEDVDAGLEPDWEALRDSLLNQCESLYSVTIRLMQAFWTVYEKDSLK
jgi:hypothetical protein